MQQPATAKHVLQAAAVLLAMASTGSYNSRINSAAVHQPSTIEQAKDEWLITPSLVKPSQT
jgi:hypothetical protein